MGIFVYILTFFNRGKKALPKFIILKTMNFLDRGEFREYKTQVNDWLFPGGGPLGTFIFDLVPFCINMLLQHVYFCLNQNNQRPILSVRSFNLM